MNAKKFRLLPEQIAPIALGIGDCLATDRIVVDGCKVGYMFRAAPLNEQDSGWQFFAGDEDEKYITEIENFDIYDVNTIVNYDPSILPFLYLPVGSALERDEMGDLFLLRDGV
ncbi:DUF2185 domain-containing protein [Duganella sp. BJB488]|uniref:DUF2185 domain-containing protein n=1 Tax=unclassified Duganella TaxID=2636909 RepID=UPI000E3414CA|nr:MULTISPECIES: DUF2185 domain-containing protein [unclassified Duganella]RFP10958.1 DUF2185 domain-containing protein [Duganella sp. BJB489]RFP14493.1 DUF2185 domain-containing protein [Duganella sp. BJB488]RFP30429.1 DUF2185 domain-containing protein [Duganella sp. BJB480]